MASLTTMEKLHLFHKLERDMFHRLVHDLAEDPASMRWVIAFWLWLESAGHRNFIRRVASMPGPVVLRFVEEAIACLRCLAGLGQAVATAGGGDRSLPCTGALMTQPIDDVGYFEGRGEIMDGVSAQYRSVCLAVCDVGSSSNGLPSNTGGAPSALLMPMVSSPIHAAPMVEPMALMNPMAPSFTLNPMAAPWIPPPPVQSPAIPEEYRSLFVTFSRGYPISKEDILEFFNSVFGPCVEKVMVEKVAPGQDPVYGRVVLRNAAMIPVVLEGQETNKFLIKGRHLWARVYVPSSHT